MLYAISKCVVTSHYEHIQFQVETDCYLIQCTLTSNKIVIDHASYKGDVPAGAKLFRRHTSTIMLDPSYVIVCQK